MGLKVGVIGTGRLGQQHVRVLGRIPEVEQVACFDVDAARCEGAAKEYGATAYTDLDGLLDAVDAVSIVVPTVEHASVSLRAIEQGKSLFVEKPIAATVDEAHTIINAARDRQRVLQVGHVERYNSALQQALPLIQTPNFIEVHRLAPFTVRGIDVSVVMDLMIHDIDLLSLLLNDRPVEIRAKGASILTDGTDIVNARLEYPSGCVVNLTASRVSDAPMRKLRVFSSQGYVSVDLLGGSVKSISKGEKFDKGVAMLREGKGTDMMASLGTARLSDFLDIHEATSEGEEPLFNELRDFCRSVASGEEPSVSGEDGLRALELATEIQALVEAGAAK